MRLGFELRTGLGFELRALCLESRHFTALATQPVHFALVILEMGVSRTICQAGLKPQSS
jgi:hypothetical protein